MNTGSTIAAASALNLHPQRSYEAPPVNTNTVRNLQAIHADIQGGSGASCGVSNERAQRTKSVTHERTERTKPKSGCYESIASTQNIIPGESRISIRKH